MRRNQRKDWWKKGGAPLVFKGWGGVSVTAVAGIRIRATDDKSNPATAVAAGVAAGSPTEGRRVELGRRMGGPGVIPGAVPL